MNQETVALTCPWCGKHSEVVSPDLYRQVKSLRAYRAWVWAGEIKQWQNCPSCKKDMFLSWTFTDTKEQGFWDWLHENIG